MLKTIKKLLTSGSEAATSGQLEDALDRAHDEIRAKAFQLGVLRRQRADRVLDASDEEIDTIEAQIMATEREIERLELAAARLEEGIPQARVREAEAEAQCQSVRAGELDAALAEDAAEYEKLAARVAGVLDRMKARYKERMSLPGACEHVHVPGWTNGPERTCIVGNRSYAFGLDFATVQLPSLTRQTPHWGDIPEYGMPRPIHVASGGPKMPTFVGLADPDSGLPLEESGARQGRKVRVR